MTTRAQWCFHCARLTETEIQAIDTDLYQEDTMQISVLHQNMAHGAGHEEYVSEKLGSQSEAASECNRQVVIGELRFVWIF